jgi:6-phosphogluconolactonase (cycloisomerase 2 family)
VTVKSTNSIYIFPLGDDNTPGKPAIWKAGGPNQPTYFGFAFDAEGHLIVTEPFGAYPVIPKAPKSAVSSFAIGENGMLTQISASVPNGRGTSCWVVVDPLTKQFAYIGNNNTSDISSYAIGSDGSLTLLAATAAHASSANDMAVAKDKGSAFLYALNGGSGTVGAWTINADGSLSFIGTFGTLPALAGAQGLAAY